MPPSVAWFSNRSAVTDGSVNWTDAVVLAPCGAVYSIEMVLPSATPGIVTVPPEGFCATAVPSTKIVASSYRQFSTVTV